MTLAERAVLRIREEMTERELNQRDLAKELKCSQGRVAKLLNGGVHLRINDVAALAAAVRLPIVEVVRDRGLDFYAELTPSEIRLLEALRRRDGLLNHFIAIMEAAPSTKTRKPVSQRRGGARPAHADATKKRA